ncbi:MAG: extracellular solute-binding protein [Planctomycetota bacterium]
MSPSRLIVVFCFALVLGVPFVFRPKSAERPAGAREVIIITPHNEQIRTEFARAFDEWHRAQYGEPAVIEWVQPGGTSEIRKQLQSVYVNAIANGRLLPDGTLGEGESPMPNDILFGGGTYEHGQMKRGVRATPPGADEPISMTISVPMGLEQSQLDAWFGENRIGSGLLYDPEQYWIGTALSGFGIVYNRDILAKLGVDEPDSWYDMADPALAGWVALADPRLSGSVATTYDSILSNYGWEDGWRILRGMGANARYFSNSSPKVPIDVSQGEAGMGVAIDFYGRYQAQAVMQPDETAATSRVGYIDPPGVVMIDADPISILRAGPNPEMARRFVEFVLTDEGQALWQFPVTEEGLGPRTFELRRQPVRREFISAFGDRFVDKVNPFEVASDVRTGAWRSAIGPMMGAFSIDIHADQVKAWRALNAARLASEAGTFPPETFEEMETLFFAMPDHTLPDGRVVPFDEEHYREVREDWRDSARWSEARIAYLRFFRENYRRIAEMWTG